MFKFFVFGVILSQAVVKNSYGQVQSSNSDSLQNDSNEELTLQKDGQYHIYASRLNLSLEASLAPKRLSGFGSNRVDGKLDADYIVTEGIGAHKLHVRKLSWVEALKTCIGEGGHLAVIRTDSEEKILVGMMGTKSVGLAWVGYHELFEEGNWFSVLGEPLAQTGWSRWSREFKTNPIPNNGHCAELKVEGGVVNKGCAEKRSFICKVSID